MCVFSVFQLFTGFRQHAAKLLQTIDQLCPDDACECFDAAACVGSSGQCLMPIESMNFPRIIGLNTSLIESHPGNPSYRYYGISFIIFGEVGEQSQERGVVGRTLWNECFMCRGVFCLA
jgi:hypothetical protein